MAPLIRTPAMVEEAALQLAALSAAIIPVADKLQPDTRTDLAIKLHRAARALDPNTYELAPREYVISVRADGPISAAVDEAIQRLNGYPDC